jgi:ribonucleoside-diphosphate reductase alpha chain
MRVSKVKKRDGRIVKFDQSKITRAIQKALQSVGRDLSGASSLSDEVVTILEEEYQDKTPGVEDIQDIVEQILIKNNFPDAAKSYILYRQKRTEMRDIKRLIGVEDDLKLSVNAIEVLKRRYLAKNDKGEIIETPSQLFRRVATAVATVD